MSTASNAREYAKRLVACLGRCASIDPQQRTMLPRKFDERKSTWILTRGFSAFSEIFQNDPEVGNPYELIHGGLLKLEVRVRDTGTKQSPAFDVAAYQLSILDLGDNPNDLRCFRFDKPQSQRRGDGWDDELDDNPQHPKSHLHINFTASEAANNCRIPVAPVCHILLFSAFDYWYCSTFGT